MLQICFYAMYYVVLRYAMAELVALCYKPEGRGFDSRWGSYYAPRVDSASNRNE